MKKRILLTILFIVFSYIIYGLYLTQYFVEIVPTKLQSHQQENIFDYSGVINVQSQSSSGSGSIQHIVSEAQRAELDFLFLTDQNHTDVFSDQEGYHDNLFLFIDGEYSYLNSRILNIGIKDNSHIKGPGQSQALIADKLSQAQKTSDSGLFILSHPLKPGFQWQGPYPPGLDGIEIINLKWIWQNAWLNSRTSFLWTLFIYPFNPRLAFIRLLDGVGYDEVKLLDKLNASQPTIAIAGTDADAKVKLLKNTSITFPSYYMLFKIVRNHILLTSELTGRDETDKEKILGALNKGQFYMSFDIFGNAKGFRAHIKDSNQKTYQMGSEIKLDNNTNLFVQLPVKPLFPFNVLLFKDGKRIKNSNKVHSQFKISEKGAYRIFVRVIPTLPFPDGRKWLPWIYTNSFYIN